jgi:hypothetical protein
MWGLNWGQMIWGQAPPVPTLGFWGVLLLGAVLGAVGVRQLRAGRSRLVGGVALGLALLVPISARALPFTFTNGTVADATQVNANFAALTNAQALGPSASSNVVDLNSLFNTTCNGQNGSVLLNLRVGPDGVGNTFTIPTGQTLMLTTVNVQLSSNSPAVVVHVYRANNGSNDALDNFVVPIVGGVGSASLTYPTGSPFGPGTQVCVAVSPGAAAFNVASAHGFLTAQ